jgi:DNA-binding NarL/FixJ family response regulator
MLINILIVDDKLMIREGIKYLLHDLKITNDTYEACDGFQAIEITKKKSFDIILMDISMPNLDGISATKEIMKNNSNNKIIAISMHTDKNDIKKMQKAGAKGYVLKDTIANTLQNAIDKTLSKEEFFILK